MSSDSECSCRLTRQFALVSHRPNCPHYSSASPKYEVPEWMDKIKKARADHFSLENKTRLRQFTANLPDTTRMFCTGEVHLPNGFHYPSILAHDTLTRKTVAYALSGIDNAVNSYDPQYFFSSIPYVGIAREVLDTSNSTL